MENNHQMDFFPPFLEDDDFFAYGHDLAGELSLGSIWKNLREAKGF